MTITWKSSTNSQSRAHFTHCLQQERVVAVKTWTLLIWNIHINSSLIPNLSSRLYKLEKRKPKHKVEENIKNNKQKSNGQWKETQKMYKDRCWFFEKVIKLKKLQLQRDQNKNELFTSGGKEHHYRPTEFISW